MDREEFTWLHSLRPLEGSTADDYVKPRLPRIVLVGPPGAGKSRTRKRLKKELGENLHVIPEVHAWMMRKCDIHPPKDPIYDLVHMREHTRIRMALEELADMQARIDGKLAVVCDRGFFDAAAYRFLFGADRDWPHSPVRELLQLMKVSMLEADSRYDLVIFLEPVNEVTFLEKCEAQRRAGKLIRTPDYAHSFAIGESLRRVWSEHHRFRVATDDGDPDRKYAQVRTLIEDLLDLSD